MLQSCKECGCKCKACNVNDLDLHHEVESLKVQLKEARHMIIQLRSDADHKTLQFETKESKLQEELTKIRERYDRLQESHRRFEKLNHDLEDKILLVVQENESERDTTLTIHQDLHGRLKDSEKCIEDLKAEKNVLAKHCLTAIDLLRTASSSADSDHVLASREITRIKRSIQRHEDSKQNETGADTGNVMSHIMPLSTFPPCAVAYNHSPKSAKRNTQIPRNYSDSRLNTKNLNTKGLNICTSCKSLQWSSDASTQTDNLYDLQETNFYTTWSENYTGIFDI